MSNIEPIKIQVFVKPQCSICLDTIAIVDSYTTLCNHTFHQECLDTWRRPDCPICRQKTGLYEPDEPDEDDEWDRIHNMFPGAQFSVCININQLDELVTDLNQIVIRSDYGCYCYGDQPRKTEYYYIAGERITYKLVIDELINQGLELYCNHQFLEDIHHVDGFLFDLWKGS